MEKHEKKVEHLNVMIHIPSTIQKFSDCRSNIAKLF